MHHSPAKVNDRAPAGDGDDARAPSPFADQDGPLTFRIVAWRAGLLLLLAVVSLTVLVSASWVVMRMYR
jgi:hypothetical protein